MTLKVTLQVVSPVIRSPQTFNLTQPVAPASQGIPTGDRTLTRDCHSGGLHLTGLSDAL